MTVKQIQNLLQYLDYYNGIPDGDFGPLTREAVTDFQRAFGLKVDGDPGPETQKALTHAVAYGMPTREEPEPTADWWDEIEFFDREEFKCKCGGQYCDGYPAEPQEKMVRIADAARKHFGAPATVSSGVRCPLRNAELPGSAPNSLHLRGKAMDFCIRGVSAAQLLEYVKSLPEVHEAYAIDASYVHMGVQKY